MTDYQPPADGEPPLESLPAADTGGVLPQHEAQGWVRAPADTATIGDRLRAATNIDVPFREPPEYSAPNGDWITVQSTDPFEVLYLDHALVDVIEPALVASHFEVLSAFWQSVIDRMSRGGARLQIAEKYGGESEIHDYPKALERARRALATLDGIKREFEKLDRARRERGQEKLLERIEPLLAAGSIAPASLRAVVNPILQEDLTAREITALLTDVLRARDFRPSAELRGDTLEDVIAVRWSTLKAERIEEIRQPDPYVALGLAEFNPFAPGHRAGLSPPLILLAYTTRAAWWHEQQDAVTSSGDTVTSAEAVERLERARAQLFDEIWRANKIAALETPSPVPAPAERVPLPPAPPKRGRGLLLTLGILAVAVVAIIVMSIRQRSSQKTPRVTFIDSAIVIPAPPPRTGNAQIDSGSKAPPTVTPAERLPAATPPVKSGSSEPVAVPVTRDVDTATKTPDPVATKADSAPVRVPQTPQAEGDSLLQEASTFFGAKAPGRAYGMAQRAANIAINTQRASGADPALEKLRTRAENLLKLALQLCDDKQDATVNRVGCP